MVIVHVGMIFLSVVLGACLSSTCCCDSFSLIAVYPTRYSILPAISLDGVLHLDIISRSWTSEEFATYLNILLDAMNPFPLPNSVLVMDNASTHHFDGVREIVEQRYSVIS